MIWKEHVKNRSAFPPEELVKYEGQHVAWSADGRRILAGDEDPLKLAAKLKAAGHQPDDFIVSYVDRPDEWALCGGFLSDDNLAS